MNRRRIFWAWLGGAVAIFLVTVIDRLAGNLVGLPLVIGSFGSSAVLLFASPELPAAQPRNLIGGHFFSALAGVACQMLFYELDPGLAAGLAVGTAIALMCLTNTLHPPGGATALIAVIGGPRVHSLGLAFVLVPLIGACLMLLVAIWSNNRGAKRPYPQRWL